MKAKELLVSAGSLLLAGLILVVAGNAVAPAAAANVTELPVAPDVRYLSPLTKV